MSSRVLISIMEFAGAGTVGLVLTRRAARDRIGGVLGAAGAAVALIVVGSARAGATQWLLAAVVGSGIGLVVPTSRARQRVSPRRAKVAGAALLVVSAALGGWTAANSPRLGWAGRIVSHATNGREEVALTFDDGPNISATLAVRDVLDTYAVKGTFFTVGKALDARPDISKALLADGQLLGNHSYAHDEWRWLDPSYPELERTQRAFARRLGVCPTFYRPPHGQHTPLMAREVTRHRMVMVGWDVSTNDWAASDPRAVARTILAQVRSGSIIDLHDGLDGNVNANRRVLVEALPLILDGLRNRHLRAVTLDQMLGVAPYRGVC